MTKQEILDYLNDINERYNNCMMYDTLSHMLDELVESVHAENVPIEFMREYIQRESMSIHDISVINQMVETYKEQVKSDR
jgi:hypothetical protein